MLPKTLDKYGGSYNQNELRGRAYQYLQEVEKLDMLTKDMRDLRRLNTKVPLRDTAGTFDIREGGRPDTETVSTTVKKRGRPRKQ